ncbi:ParA family protein [Natrialba taiwanensis]|uniref:Chromosome partitioning protein ParA n=1 Tax=Natrialba taiwanensis DSM 12281 TaxID=1230458 RepID=M0A0M6_9EURY|nr:ParA family protein [Natrialba taiwanensis]ELY91387.1 chromosome partitioning protein ParA [Natrialba taiwanensis DSM 12281]
MRAAAFLDKGGVGKTTATAHFGVALHNDGFDVLMIDLAGKQNDLAKHFGLLDEIEASEQKPNIAHVFDDSWDYIVENVPDVVDQLTFETDEGPDLIPAHKGLDQVDDELASRPVEDRDKMFDDFLTSHVESQEYDVILIDLPGLTNNITLNGLQAARKVIAPVELGEFEEQQLKALHEDLEEFNAALDETIEVSMVIPNRVQSNTNLGKQLLEELREDYAETVAPVHIPQSQDIRNAQKSGKTTFALEEPSNTATRAREAYQVNANELVDRINE